MKQPHPSDDAVRQCPFPFYEHLRDTCPVYAVPNEDYYLVTKAEDCMMILTNAELFSSHDGPGLSKRKAPSAAARAVIRSGYRRLDVLVSSDPPRHDRYRKLVNKAFTPRRISSLAPAIADTIDTLIDALPMSGEIDFVTAFAVPLPIRVIADILGVPRSDQAQFRTWTDAAVAIMDGIEDEQTEVAAEGSLVALQHYFAAKLDERRARPQDDFLTDLLAARTSDADPLTTEEILAILYVLLVAGNETTTNLLSAAMLLLAQHPHEQSRLRADPSLVPQFIEEALRLQAPVQGLMRTARHDSEVGGVPIAAGTKLIAMIGSANYDEARFTDSSDLNIDRPNVRTHTTFGMGRHFCVGAGLARLEAVTAFEKLLAARPLFSLPATFLAPRYVPNFLFRGLASLPLHLGDEMATSGEPRSGA